MGLAMRPEEKEGTYNVTTKKEQGWHNNQENSYEKVLLFSLFHTIQQRPDEVALLKILHHLEIIQLPYTVGVTSTK